MAVAGFGGTEILQIADAVAREKNITRDLVLDAMADSIAVAARKKYGHYKNIRAEIDRKTGEIKLFKELEVVEDSYKPIVDEEGEEESMNDKIHLAYAREKYPEIKVGEFTREPLPPIDLGRVAAQTAKQVIVQKVRDAERDRQFNDFKARVGEIVHGVVKRVEFGNVIVDIGNAEAVIKKDGMIRGENFRVNERIRAYLEKVSRENKGPQIFLSRTAPQFMAKLFSQEVPEIYDGIIVIKAVAREPGSRAKIAVASNDSSIDPVGSCVGVRGARVQAVIAELQGEKIDIVQWSADPATFLVNALAPAEVTKVVIDEEKNRVEAIVPNDQLSLAIGRRGQNVRLAAELVGWNVDVMTEESESTRRADEFAKLSGLFTEALNIEEIIAHLLVTEGFVSIEDVAMVSLEELASIEGFDEEIAGELQARAKEYLEQSKIDKAAIIKKLGVQEALRKLSGISDDILVKLGENSIKTLDDFADLSRDEFREIVPESGMSNEDIDALIMESRSHWFSGNENEAISVAGEAAKVAEVKAPKKRKKA
jgi:N utilization substance protein A